MIALKWSTVILALAFLFLLMREAVPALMLIGAML